MDLYKNPRLRFYHFMLRFTQPFVVWFFKLKGVGRENLPKEGPYVIVANHSHLLDPFFIGALIKKPVFQMASNEFFRKPLQKRFMWAMGAFPRKKGFADLKSIKYAISLVKKGHPLVIYPEGGRNWDGETLPVMRSTAGLIKLLNVPLVTVVSKGNYIAFPRWAEKRRRSPITIHYSKPAIFDKSTPDEEIIEHIRKGIYNNDNFTKIKRVKGKSPAEGLPRLLWRCPECRALEALAVRRGRFIVCTRCGREWEVNLNCCMRERNLGTWKTVKEYADLMFRDGEITPMQHHADMPTEPGESVYLRSKRILLFHEPGYPRLKKLGNGTLYLTDRRLAFVDELTGKVRSYPFSGIRGRSTEKNFIFQVVLDDDIARFEMPDESCLKWELFYDYVRRKCG